MSESSQALFDHVVELTELYLRDEIEADQLAELEALVRGDAYAADAMRTVLRQAGAMRVVFNEQRQFAHRVGEINRDEYLKLLQTLSPAEEPEPVQWAGQSSAHKPIWLRWPVAIPSGIAALLAIAVTLIVMLSGNTTAPSPPPIANHDGASDPVDPVDPVIRPVVATLTAERDAEWSLGDSAARDAQLRAGDRLSLTQGFVEITTRQGAVAILEAPTTVELLNSPNALRLHTGKLVGLCRTKASKGFVVLTDYADITDLGTEFGVEASGEQVTATVFTGEVELTTLDGELKPLTANQTARVSVQGKNHTVVVEEKLAEGFENLLRPAVVTDARINLDGYEVRVVPRGFYEEARVHTDRILQFNGIDAGGLPDELKDGDLVMMPANLSRARHKPAANLRLDIDLAQPAEVYLLYPTHADKEPWLERDYEPTGLVVSAERVVDSLPQEANEAGKRFDQQFNVWKRTATTAGTLTAGYDIGTSMYAVIVVPKTSTQR